MIKGVSEEHTLAGARGELVGHSGREIRVASVPKDSKVAIGGRGAQEGEVWCGGTDRFGR